MPVIYLNCKYGEVLSTSKDIYFTVTEHVGLLGVETTHFFPLLFGVGVLSFPVSLYVVGSEICNILTFLQYVNSI
jgi:hypothetical protein